MTAFQRRIVLVMTNHGQTGQLSDRHAVRDQGRSSVDKAFLLGTRIERTLICVTDKTFIAKNRHVLQQSQRQSEYYRAN